AGHGGVAVCGPGSPNGELSAVGVQVQKARLRRVVLHDDDARTLSALVDLLVRILRAVLDVGRARRDRPIRRQPEQIVVVRRRAQWIGPIKADRRAGVRYRQKIEILSAEVVDAPSGLRRSLAGK